MSDNQFETLEQIIRTRRSVSWGKMNGRIIEDDAVNKILALADWAGLSSNREYMDDLEDEISGCRDAFVGAAVTEIASLRGALGGRLSG